MNWLGIDAYSKRIIYWPIRLTDLCRRIYSGRRTSQSNLQKKKNTWKRNILNRKHFFCKRRILWSAICTICQRENVELSPLLVWNVNDMNENTLETEVRLGLKENKHWIIAPNFEEQKKCCRINWWCFDRWWEKDNFDFISFFTRKIGLN